MASMWRKAMLYLGLGPDDEYDDYDAVEEPVAPARQQQSSVSPRPYASQAAMPAEPEHSGAVRTLQPQPVEGVGSVRPRTAVVRPIQPVASAKPHVITPSSFNDVQEVADRFKNTVPVIVNLQGVDRDLSRRLIDFASGLCYGLGGQMEKVANQVYLLTPTNVEVSAEERRRLQERGFNDE
jgi:cell division inhibitor SepF